MEALSLVGNRDTFALEQPFFHRPASTRVIPPGTGRGAHHAMTGNEKGKGIARHALTHCLGSLRKSASRATSPYVRTSPIGITWQTARTLRLKALEEEPGGHTGDRENPRRFPGNSGLAGDDSTTRESDNELRWTRFEPHPVSNGSGPREPGSTPLKTTTDRAEW